VKKGRKRRWRCIDSTAFAAMAEEAAEKHIFAASGVKNSYSFQGGYRRARSAAPAKIAVFPQPVNLAALRAGTRYFGHP
jgi:hypothetical protein